MQMPQPPVVVMNNTVVSKAIGTSETETIDLPKNDSSEEDYRPFSGMP